MQLTFVLCTSLLFKQQQLSIQGQIMMWFLFLAVNCRAACLLACDQFWKSSTSSCCSTFYIYYGQTTGIRYVGPVCNEWPIANHAHWSNSLNIWPITFFQQNCKSCPFLSILARFCMPIKLNWSYEVKTSVHLVNTLEERGGIGTRLTFLTARTYLSMLCLLCVTWFGEFGAPSLTLFTTWWWFEKKPSVCCSWSFFSGCFIKLLHHFLPSLCHKRTQT